LRELIGKFDSQKNDKITFKILPSNFHLFNCDFTDNVSTKKENMVQVSSIVDTLNYEKKDYDLMRDYFSADTLLVSNLSKGIQVGDTNSIKFQKLLTTEYELRDKIGICESEIDALIFSHYARKTVMEKFEEIESRLQKAGADPESAKRKSDSVINRIEELTEEMKELVKEN
jgi:chromosome segregation ATPase